MPCALRSLNLFLALHLSSLPRLVLLDFPRNMLPMYTTSGDVRVPLEVRAFFVVSSVRHCCLISVQTEACRCILINTQGMSDLVRIRSALLELLHRTDWQEHSSHYELHQDDKVQAAATQLSGRGLHFDSCSPLFPETYQQFPLLQKKGAANLVGKEATLRSAN